MNSMNVIIIYIIFVLIMNLSLNECLDNKADDSILPIIKWYGEQQMKMTELEEKMNQIIYQNQIKEARIKKLEDNMEELKQYKVKTLTYMHTLEKNNQLLINNINLCTEKLEVLKGEQESLKQMIQNDILSADISTTSSNSRRLLSSTNNNLNNNVKPGITMNDGTSIRFIQNDVTIASLSHVEGVLKLNGTLQSSNQVLDVNGAIVNLQNQMSNTTKVINVPNDFSTISAAILSLKSIYYNEVIIQLAEGNYTENVIIKDIIVPKGLTIKGGDSSANSHVINSVSDYSIKVVGCTKVIIQGIKFKVANAIYVERSYVEIKSVHMTSSGVTGIECNNGCQMKVAGTNFVDSDFYGILATNGGRVEINGDIIHILGPGLASSGGRSGLHASLGASIHLSGSTILNISNYEFGIFTRYGGAISTDCATCQLHIKNCNYGIQSSYNGHCFINSIGSASVDVPSNGGAGVVAEYASSILLKSTAIFTPSASSAAEGLYVAYGSVVRMTDVTVSDNWTSNKVNLYNSALICAGSSCPDQGASSVNVQRMGYYFKTSQVEHYCASESASCTAV